MQMSDNCQLVQDWLPQQILPWIVLCETESQNQFYKAPEIQNYLKIKLIKRGIILTCMGGKPRKELCCLERALGQNSLTTEIRV